MKNSKITIDEGKILLTKYFLDLNPNVNLEALSFFVNEFSIHKIDKKTIILNAGEKSDTVYFILNGLVRIYYEKEDKEITSWFIKENMLFAPTYSILTGNNNYTTYETLEDTYVLKTNYAVFEMYYAKYHSIECLGRKIIESYYGKFMKKTYDVLYLSAEERYSLFLQENSDLLIRVSLKYIASYLGIKQETLSRLRAKH